MWFWSAVIFLLYLHLDPFLLVWPRFRVYGWQAGCLDTWFIDWEVLAELPAFPHSHINYQDWKPPRTLDPVLTWTHTPAYTGTKSHIQIKTLFLLVWELLRGLFTWVTQMFVLAPQQVMLKWLFRLFWGLGGLLRAKQGPRARMRAFFVRHKALSVLGKAMGMGTSPGAGHWAAIPAFRECLCESGAWVSVGDRKGKCALTCAVCVKVWLRRWKGKWKDNIRGAHCFSASDPISCEMLWHPNKWLKLRWEFFQILMKIYIFKKHQLLSLVHHDHFGFCKSLQFIK